MADVTDASWDGDSARYTIEQWRRSCLINHGGDETVKSNFSLPVREPDGTLNRHGLAAAAGRLNQVQNVTAAQRAAAARKLISLYHEANMTPPDHLRELAGRGASTDDDSVGAPERMYTPDAPVEIRSGPRTIGGYAATFGSLSRRMSFGHEQVSPGAFDESLSKGWPDVLCRADHDSRMLLGATHSRTLTLAVDHRGLDYQCELPAARQDVYEGVQRRDYQGSSFSFHCDSDTWEFRNGAPLRTLVAVQLQDVGPCTTPAYTSSTVALRSLARCMDADPAEVEMYAHAGELRKFFTRTGQPPRRESAMDPYTARPNTMDWHTVQLALMLTKIPPSTEAELRHQRRELAELRAMRS
ncbi:MAG TPA: HK97 family phage prohead protease [Mycobacterium sp.]|nr:HK97 family phage prohead protease [Mycobacterium sp.]HTX96851.1 HK97 family phage prohead protease [Mycobacterium sp.]